MIRKGGVKDLTYAGALPGLENYFSFDVLVDTSAQILL
jgi:hypothetical protein